MTSFPRFGVGASDDPRIQTRWSRFGNLLAFDFHFLGVFVGFCRLFGGSTKIPFLARQGTTGQLNHLAVIDGDARSVRRGACGLMENLLPPHQVQASSVGPAPPGSAPPYCVECTVTSLVVSALESCEPGNLNFYEKGIPHQNPGCRTEPSNRAFTGPCAPRPRFLCTRSEIWKSWRTHARADKMMTDPSPCHFFGAINRVQGPKLGIRKDRLWAFGKQGQPGSRGSRDAILGHGKSTRHAPRMRNSISGGIQHALGARFVKGLGVLQRTMSKLQIRPIPPLLARRGKGPARVCSGRGWCWSSEVLLIPPRPEI